MKRSAITLAATLALTGAQLMTAASAGAAQIVDVRVSCPIIVADICNTCVTLPDGTVVCVDDPPPPPPWFCELVPPACMILNGG